MTQSPKPVHIQPLCILCAVNDRRKEWGSVGYPVWPKVKGTKMDFGGRVYACADHWKELEAKARAEGTYTGKPR